MSLTGHRTFAPLRFAWLLRADLRAGRSTKEIPEDFRLWWATSGRREYPSCAQADSAAALDLLSPLPEWPVFGHFGMSRLLRYLLDTREDLRCLFDVSSESGLWGAIAWLYVHGIDEYRLQDAVDAETLAALDETPPFLKFSSLKPGGDGQPPLTWLMFFVWRCSEDLQKTFDLHDTQGRFDYLLWFFFDGVPNLRLAGLLAPRWKNWLRDPVRLSAADDGATVARAALLQWLKRHDLKKAFDLSQPEGIAGLSRWAEDAWHVEPGMRWLATDAGRQTMTCQPSASTDRPFGVNLIGFAFGELGIGEDVRMAVSACEAAGIPFKVVNIHPGNNLRQADDALAQYVGDGLEADPAPYRFNLFCLTGFDTVRVFLERGKTLFAGHFNIGWWPWELPVWPSDWRSAFALVDEVWAATTFTRDMYVRAQVDGLASTQAFSPVTLMPLPASVARVKAMTRQQLGLPARRCLFLYVFDFNSYLARKNPFAAVKAFRRAFPMTDQGVGLVLKTMNSHPENPVWQRFLRECAKDKRIVILEKTLARGEVLGLIEACDVYVSLHRSEGFGRTLAEAMLFGKPVVGTDFSGNVDFLEQETGFPVQWKRRAVVAGEYPFVTKEDRAWWAEPDMVDAARQMRAARAVAGDTVFSGKVRTFAEWQFSPARVGERMRQRLQALWTV